ncbi:MAG: hypothetical protein EX271_01360 [Acidimicrobiales bacterium]|nr:hypothetical protein [Hyphomonadaceae bacterium]RZV44596.1 MAG: hypothetical protein EX271_01360 [Acidimicrobiales bacterium]
MGWDVGSILLLYWLESVVIGLLNVPKILSARGNIFGKVFDSAFFTIHFGGFCAGHVFFLKEMFEVDISLPVLFSFNPITIAAASFFISHFVSMMVNFYGKGEYKTRSANNQMFLPYGRVVIMHITILLGGLLAQKFGAPVYALIFLIGLKTFIDLAAHNKEHTQTEIKL